MTGWTTIGEPSTRSTAVTTRSRSLGIGAPVSIAMAIAGISPQNGLQCHATGGYHLPRIFHNSLGIFPQLGSKFHQPSRCGTGQHIQEWQHFFSKADIRHVGGYMLIQGHNQDSLCPRIKGSVRKSSPQLDTNTQAFISILVRTWDGAQTISKASPTKGSI